MLKRIDFPTAGSVYQHSSQHRWGLNGSSTSSKRRREEEEEEEEVEDTRWPGASRELPAILRRRKNRYLASLLSTSLAVPNQSEIVDCTELYKTAFIHM